MSDSATPDGSPPGSPVPGILQARTLEWVAISFSNAWKWKMKVKSLSHVQLLVTPWTAAYQAPPTMGFSRQEYWSGVPLPSPNHVLSVSKLIKEGMTLAPHNLTSKFVIYRHFFWVLYFMAISVTREFIFWKMFVHRNPYVPHRHGVLCNIRKMWKQPKLKWRGKSALPWRHLLAVDK